jgi:diketogulonate reductase-like aldo/keto reductase
MDQMSATLPDGVVLPLLGLGTWQARGKGAYWAVRTALDLGYRHLDTATVYRNEGSVGEALRDSGVPRDELAATTTVTPAVNQIRWHVERYDASVVAAHTERGVLLEGWAPFKHTDMSAPPLADAAAAHAKSPQQVVLRWHLQHGIAVIPKSTHRERIAANLDVFDFELTDAEMERIDALG